MNTEGLRLSLRNNIKKAFDTPIDEKSNSDEAKQFLANAIADAIADGVDAWIKTAVVTVQAGISVQTAGSPTAQSGFTTSIGSGTIS